jgi:hypothetical protein
MSAWLPNTRPCAARNSELVAHFKWCIATSNRADALLFLPRLVLLSGSLLCCAEVCCAEVCCAVLCRVTVLEEELRVMSPDLTAIQAYMDKEGDFEAKQAEYAQATAERDQVRGVLPECCWHSSQGSLPPWLCPPYLPVLCAADRQCGLLTICLINCCPEH